MATINEEYADIFRRAAEVLGGKERLRELLEVSEAQCEAWTSGRSRPSAKTLAKVVDVLLVHIQGKRMK